MKIAHLAIWTNQLEQLRDFYCNYFGAKSNEKYLNPAKQFTSFFLTFENGSCGLELMSKPNLDDPLNAELKTTKGLAHFAFSVGSEANVDKFTARLREAGVRIIGEPRHTGDGFYESVIKDPDGNIIEITV